MKKTTLALMATLSLSSSLFASTLSSEIKNSSLVVYNSNIGLVHEERDLSLKSSDTSIIYEGVASSINTDSINVTLNPLVSLKSQQFRFDSLTLSKLLDAHIGKKIEVRLLRNRNEFKIIFATLLSHGSQNSIVRTVDYKIISVKNSDIMFSSIPKELITKPSLVWNVDVKKDVDETMKLDYLINNITFKSDYILNVDQNRSQLTGWITIDNRSGKAFKETKLSLLAGDINRVNANRPTPYRAKSMRVMSDSVQASHQAYEGYHFYTIPFKVSLANNEKTQLKFIAKDGIATSREYSATLNNPLYVRSQIKSDVNQYISIEGIESPLPKGTLRTYSKLDGRTILLGENHISHTPKNTSLKLKIGKNFDIKVTQTPTSRDDSKSRFDVTMEYKLTNNSDQQRVIELLIPFNTDESSKIRTEKNYTFTKGNLVTFSVTVGANSSESFKVNFKSRKNG